MDHSVDKFWIVWNPSSHLPPKHKHSTFQSAQGEAERLAGVPSNRGQWFFVMEFTGGARVASVSRLVPRERPDDDG